MASWASELAGALIDKAVAGGSKTPLMLASIDSTSPLSISVYGQTITQNLYVNAAWTLEATDTTPSKIEKMFETCAEPPDLKAFLQEYHERSVLHPGDEVIVLQIDTSFFVLAKVVGSNE